MRVRILKALLGLALVALIAVCAVAFHGLNDLGEYARSEDDQLGRHAIDVSRDSLIAMVDASLRSEAKRQANRLASALATVEAEARSLGATLSALMEAPRLAPRRSFGTDEPPPDVNAWSVAFARPGVRTDPLAIPAQLDPIAQAVFRSAPYVSLIEVATPGGQVRMLPWTNTIPNGYDPATRDWYRDAMRTNAIGWTGLYVGATTDALQLTCYAPVADRGGEIVAIVGVVVLIERLIDDSTLALHDTVLVDRELHVLARKGLSAGATVWSAAPPKTTWTVPDAAASELLAELVATGRTGIVRTTVDGQDSFVAVAPVGDRPLSSLLVMTAAQALGRVQSTTSALAARSARVQRDVRQHVENTLVHAAAVVALALIVMLWAGNRLARNIAHPLTQLEAQARRIGSGDLSHRAVIASDDELGSLARTLNSMSEQLDRHMRALELETANRERMASELKLAQDIQASLMPRTFPPFPKRPEVDIHALMDPAREIGGDFYDFFFLDDRHLCLVVADVADKGIPAAIFMAGTRALLRMQCGDTLAPEEILRRTNEVLALDNDENMFVSVICAVLDTEDGTVRVASGGHPTPLCTRADGTVQALEVPYGMSLGPFAGVTYQSRSFELARGEGLLLYSDGVTEAANPDDELFGEQRLRQSLATTATHAARDAVAALRADLQQFAGSHPQADDITILALRYLGHDTSPSPRDDTSR